MNSKTRIPETNFPDALPVLPLMSTVVFPLGISTLHVGYQRNLRLLEDINKPGQIIALTWAGSGISNNVTFRQLSTVGVAAKIMKIEDSGEGAKQLAVEGISRVQLGQLTQDQPYFVARVGQLSEPEGDLERQKQLVGAIMELVQRLVEMDSSYPAELYHILSMNKDRPGKFADMVASSLHFELAWKQKILEELIPEARLTELTGMLETEITRAQLSKNLTFDARQDLERKVKEQVLREELRTIREELGEIGLQEREVEELKAKIKVTRLPSYVEKQALLEVERLRLISTASAEYGMVRTHIDWLLSLPWTKEKCDEVDIDKLEAILNREHFGQSKVKQDILQLFSVRKLKGDFRGIAICFAGPAGTGKTSLALSIAKGLGRKFVRISVAGMRDEAEIKGFRSTYAEASPGKILAAIREVGCSNPLIMIEQADKMASEHLRGDPFGALAEVLDPDKSSHFVDNYLGVPFDLSDALFVITALVGGDVPSPIYDLVDVVEFSGFIEEEKLEIAKKFIMPAQLKKHGLTAADIAFSDEALKKVIRQYTVEAGIKGLQREMESICRRCARAKASQSFEPCRVTAENLEEYLGVPVYIPDKVPKFPEIGVAVGLAWTEAGGDLMLIEALKMRGNGQVIFTGQLGDVMKESIQAAHSYVRSKAEILGINYDDFTSYDIHIHFPSGSIPKDGPSAGVTVSLVIASVMSDRPIRNDVAMTGEISLRGRVIPVAGVREKASAAHRVGIHTVILPKGNEKNLMDLPEKIKQETEFIFVERIEEVFKHALMEQDETQRGIEDILRREIGKIAQAEKKKANKSKAAKRKAAKTGKRR
jgi:ATP-dependent Lon protease